MPEYYSEGGHNSTPWIAIGVILLILAVVFLGMIKEILYERYKERMVELEDMKEEQQAVREALIDNVNSDRSRLN